MAQADHQRELMAARDETATMRQQLSRAELEKGETGRRLSTAEAELQHLRDQASSLDTESRNAKSAAAAIDGRLADVQAQLSEAERTIAANTVRERTTREEIDYGNSAAEESSRWGFMFFLYCFCTVLCSK